MEKDLKSKMRGEEVKEPTDFEKEQAVKKRAERSAELEFELRAKLADVLNQESSSSVDDDGKVRKNE